jgi:hypothetical protein
MDWTIYIQMIGIHPDVHPNHPRNFTDAAQNQLSAQLEEINRPSSLLGSILHFEIISASELHP